MYHNGFHVPIASSIVDLHLWLLHENDLIALGLYPSFFNYRELEIALEKEVGLKTDVPFVMNWVQNGKDPVPLCGRDDAGGRAVSRLGRGL